MLNAPRTLLRAGLVLALAALGLFAADLLGLSAEVSLTLALALLLGGPAVAYAASAHLRPRQRLSAEFRRRQSSRRPARLRAREVQSSDELRCALCHDDLCRLCSECQRAPATLEAQRTPATPRRWWLLLLGIPAGLLIWEAWSLAAFEIRYAPAVLFAITAPIGLLAWWDGVRPRTRARRARPLHQPAPTGTRRLRCSACRKSLEQVCCRSCNSLYHEACQRELGGCASLGCAPRARSRRSRRSSSQPEVLREAGVSTDTGQETNRRDRRERRDRVPCDLGASSPPASLSCLGTSP